MNCVGLKVRLLPRSAASGRDRLEREVTSTDREIDELVYELYGVTGEERKIIEKA